MKDGRKVVGFAVQAIRVNSSPMSVVKTGSVIPSAGCLLCPDERTQDALACPKRGHNQTHAPQQTAQLLDHTVSDREHSRRDNQAERSCGFEINDKLKRRWTFN